MSESDDTDVLLLIPPNYLLVAPHPNEQFERHFDLELLSKSPPFMSSQSELESINARLAQIERDFPTASDISSISHCPPSTVRNGLVNRNDVPFRSQSPQGLVHSTPKVDDNFRVPESGTGVLQEIDAYFSKKSQEFTQPARSSLGTTVRLSEWTKQQPSEEEPLISLKEIWGKEDNGQNVTVQEEILRRKHCERTIQALQVKLLEYQQKIAVAIEVDRKKDAIIQKHSEENLNLKLHVQRLSADIQNFESRQLSRIQQLQSENAALKSQKDLIETDLNSFRSTINDLEDKNHVLEGKFTQLMRASNETADVYKKQISDLEVRLSNSHHSRGQLEETLATLKSQLVAAEAAAKKVTSEHSLSAKELEMRQEEVKLLQQQKRETVEKYRDEKFRADSLLNEKKLIEDNLQELRRKETNVLKELESQRISLKSYYQQQLEQVVSKKLTEFQTQLDRVEEKLQNEAKEREKLIAERAIKQIEMINVKNEQEIELLQQKHREEVELYRIQLTNASKTIDELREKLDGYRTKRADIASKLHNIMESQWQKALEVLTSPSVATGRPNDLSVEKINQNKVDGVELKANVANGNADNDPVETQVANRTRKVRDKRKEEQLQAYIQLLLNKSPRDLDNLEEILQSVKPSNTTVQQQSHIKNEPTTSAQKQRYDDKPPWK